jgi:hypothetical protein
MSNYSFQVPKGNLAIESRIQQRQFLCWRPPERIALEPSILRKGVVSFQKLRMMFVNIRGVSTNA